MIQYLTLIAGVWLCSWSAASFASGVYVATIKEQFIAGGIAALPGFTPENGIAIEIGTRSERTDRYVEHTVQRRLLVSGDPRASSYGHRLVGAVEQVVWAMVTVRFQNGGVREIKFPAGKAHHLRPDQMFEEISQEVRKSKNSARFEILVETESGTFHNFAFGITACEAGLLYSTRPSY